MSDIQQLSSLCSGWSVYVDITPNYIATDAHVFVQSGQENINTTLTELMYTQVLVPYEYSIKIVQSGTNGNIAAVYNSLKPQPV